MTQIAAIVLNHERAQLTQACLESLLSQRHHRGQLTIYCVDNGSSEQCRTSLTAWLESRGGTCPPEQATIVWIPLADNRGYSGGVNAALREIKKRGTDYVWILNNDTVIHESALSSLLASSQQLRESALIGATIIDTTTSENQQLQCAGGCRFSPWTTFTVPNHRGKPVTEIDALPELPLDFVFGASIFAPARIIEDVGPFDEDRFFLYCEELDYARRAQQCGYQLAWARDAQITHKGGATTLSRSAERPDGSARSFYFENLSTLRLLAKHHKVALLPAAVIRVGFKFGTALLLARWPEFRQVLRAYAHFITGRGWRPAPLEKPQVFGYEG